jgi:Arc/MetJ family transcription regulator
VNYFSKLKDGEAENVDGVNTSAVCPQGTYLMTSRSENLKGTVARDTIKHFWVSDVKSVLSFGPPLV